MDRLRSEIYMKNVVTKPISNGVLLTGRKWKKFLSLLSQKKEVEKAEHLCAIINIL